MSKPESIWRGTRFFASLVVLSLITMVLLSPVLARENLHFLDRQAGDVEAAFQKVQEIPEDARGPDEWSDLGWLELLYRSDMKSAQMAFTRALALDPEHELANEGILLVHLSRGRDEELTQTAFRLVRRDPNSPSAEFYISHLSTIPTALDVASETTDYRLASYFPTFGLKPLPKRLEIIESLYSSATGTPDHDETRTKLTNGFVIYHLRCLLYLHYVEKRDWEKALEFHGGRGQIPEWYVLGYFGKNGIHTLYEVLEPERDMDVSKSYTYRGEKIEWQKMKLVPGRPFLQNQEKLMKGTGSTIFYISYIHSPKERTVALRLTGDSSMDIWMNRHHIAKVDRFRNYLPYEIVIPATLREGWNMLFLKEVMDGQTFFNLRVTDFNGHDIPELRITVDFEDGPPEICYWPSSPHSTEAPSKGALDIFQKIESPTFPDVLKYASLLILDDQVEKGFKEFETLYARHPDSTLAAFFLARATQLNELLPDEFRANKARELFERIIERDPAFVPAYVSLGLFYLEKDQDKAIEYLQKAVAANPDSIQPHALLMHIFAERGWEAEQLDKLKKLTSLIPDSPRTLALWRQRYFGMGNYLEARKYQEKIIAAGEEHHDSLADILMQIGDYEGARRCYLQRISDFPHRPENYYQLAYLGKRLKRFEEAEEMLKKAIELAPRPNEYREAMARLYHLFGKTDQATRILQETLELPAKDGLYCCDTRRFLEHLSGGEIDPFEEFRVDTEAIIQNAPNSAEFPDVPTVKLFEQCVTRLFGDDLKGKEIMIHNIVKILSKKGAEEYGRLYIKGKLEEARVFTPDGRVLERDLVQEEESLALPELDAGSILEIRYTTSETLPHSDRLRYLDVSQYFRKHEEPVLHLQYILVIPENAEHQFILKNQSPEPVVRQRNGLKIYIWDIKNIKEYETELLMPPLDEVIPSVEFIAGENSLDDVFEVLRSKYLALKVPENVREKALQLTDGIEETDEKIRALYEFVVTEIKSGQTENPSHTLINGEGDAFHLLLALLRAANIEAYPAAIMPDMPYGVDWDLGAGISFNERAIFLPEGARWLDPQRFMAMGSLRANLYGGRAYIVTPHGGFLTTVPEKPGERASETLVRINLREDGSADCDVEMRLPNWVGAVMRAAFEQVMNPELIRLQMERFATMFFKGAILLDHYFSDFDVYEDSFVIRLRCEAPAFARAIDGELQFKTVVAPLELTGLAREPEREFPIDLASISRHLNKKMKLEITLPAYTSFNIPCNVAILEEFGYYSLRIWIEGQVLHIERQIEIKSLELPPEANDRLLRFARAVDNAEDSSVRVFLTRTKIEK